MSGADRAFAEALEAALAELALSPSLEERQKLFSHYKLLVAWNRKVSLTTIRDPREIAFRHFGESLFVAKELPEGDRSVLDVGSGPGFPGLPIAAVRPDLGVTLVESVQRKAVFLREVSREWGNVQVRNERLENLSGEWDVAVMRAVAVSDVLAHLARVGRSCGLLVGEDAVETAHRSRFFAWETPVSVPWGERRYLLWGQRVAVP